MDVRELKIAGAYHCVPDTFPDARGHLASPYQEAAFTAATGHGLFPVRQTNHSRSRRGVVRGVHFTTTPPGQAKYVHCSQGRALDIVVDVRVGSPTFGVWESVVLTAEHPSGVYLPIGVGHAFVALEDTAMTYLLSVGYTAAHEQAVSVFDPTLDLPVPHDGTVILSERDRDALTLAEAADRDLLPHYDTSLAVEAALYGTPPAEAHTRPGTVPGTPGTPGPQGSDA
ncbi:dTDP-4-dehydrorhamnose 3,5-epimerase family protein [Streptomyces sp. I05A-00742]|uniref:dTDP-4-dehydrorhamnose 3,5-epimerase family protein n=1 Tax=Streptomyces sp. I05A-00742 TaxID=2732853 RepID=UPI0014896B76|nr:dTDP-4-dehydrorhamnose 3,5-epimerase family protein [Streptomyces sp. I05A-00742]